MRFSEITRDAVAYADQKTSIKSKNGIENDNLNELATIIVAFAGPGMVGSIAANYIIEQLHMHQIASVESPFVIPGVIYVGGKLRHPFRIYTDKGGNRLCVILCEVPIMTRGVYSVLNALMGWIKKHNAREVIVLDGFPDQGELGSKRNALILSSDSRAAAFTNSGIEPIEDHDDNTSATGHFTAFIEGISGGLLATCLSNQVKCAGLFIPTYYDIPDAEGAAILIESINSYKNYRIINIDTNPLRKKGEHIRKDMENMIKLMLAQKHKKEEQDTSGARMYT